jgi:hypothetical protein
VRVSAAAVVATAIVATVAGPCAGVELESRELAALGDDAEAGGVGAASRLGAEVDHVAAVAGVAAAVGVDLGERHAGQVGAGGVLAELLDGLRSRCSATVASVAIAVAIAAVVVASAGEGDIDAAVPEDVARAGRPGAVGRLDAEVGELAASVGAGRVDLDVGQRNVGALRADGVLAGAHGVDA